MLFYDISHYIMLLKERGLYISSDDSLPDSAVTALTYDSRAVFPGTLFIVKGAAFREEYLADAMVRGASAYVAEKQYGVTGGIIVKDIRKAMVCLSREFYNDPQNKMMTFGITGTKGKSTTACFLRSILDADAKSTGSKNCGIISSVETYDGINSFVPHQTTPEAPDVWKHLRNAEDSGFERFIVEVSSQALKYDRVAELNFSVGCFTNIDIDHISPIEHSDFDDYFNSKLKIFDQCRIACVNRDDPRSQTMIDYIGGRVPVITFGSGKDCTVSSQSIIKRGSSTFFYVKTPEWETEMELTMPGLFNVSNALAAVSMAFAAGISSDIIKKALRTASASGRMQIYRSDDENVTVIVDYAHNRLSFEALYDSAAIEYPDCSVISIFGCTGGKSQNRRKDVGLISGERSEYVIITEKDAADEPFCQIADEIAMYVGSTGCRYDIIEDRAQALRKAFEVPLKNKKRIIIFAGRGEETGQKRGNKIVDYPSDVAITEEMMKKYNFSVREKALN